mgnify:CR=1 FL=1
MIGDHVVNDFERKRASTSFCFVGALVCMYDLLCQASGDAEDALTAHSNCGVSKMLDKQIALNVLVLLICCLP